MDLDFMLNGTWDSMNPDGGMPDFHAELQMTALNCAHACASVQDEWNDMLSTILHNWDAEIKMSQFEAVDYMMNVCGYGYFGKDTIGIDTSDFWFLQSEQYKNLKLEGSKCKRLYYVTIAVFETVNYWCWHDSPVPITFDSKGLKEVLAFGNIRIDWDSYEKYNG